MNNIEYGFLKDIPNQGTLVKSLRSRSLLAPILAFVLAVIFFVVDFKFHILVGVLLIIITMICFFAMKDYVVIDMYEHSLICYDVYDANKAVCFQFEEIKNWEINADKSDLIIHLNDGSMFAQYSPSTIDTYRLLNKYLGDKVKQNTSQKAAKKIKEDLTKKK